MNCCQLTGFLNTNGVSSEGFSVHFCNGICSVFSASIFNEGVFSFHEDFGNFSEPVEGIVKVSRNNAARNSCHIHGVRLFSVFIFALGDR